METGKDKLKTVTVIVLIAVITAFHYGFRHSDTHIHIIHREMYFLPILLTAFWFGLKAGVLTAVIVSAIYSPLLIALDGTGHTTSTVFFQILMFILVGALLGWLVNRRKSQQEAILRTENLSLLGRAASSVGYEMRQILEAIEPQKSNLKNGRKNIQSQSFATELQRLRSMSDILISFVPPEEIEPISMDLNVVVNQRIRQAKDRINKQGIVIERDLDARGCPTMMDEGKMNTVIDQLLMNALDVSVPGKKIFIATNRFEGNCTLSIQDQGAGILPENISKIFTPFFTTKKNGQGLALAVCKKYITEAGGSIDAHSTAGEGALFTVTLPIEGQGHHEIRDRITQQKG